MYICKWGSIRRRELSVGLSLSPGQNSRLEKDSQAATGSWWASATPSSVTRQHYQQCCTCALDINYHFLLTVCIFIYAFSFRIMRHSWMNKIFIYRMSAPISQLAHWVKHAPVQGKRTMPVLLLSSRHPGCSLSPRVAGTAVPPLPATQGFLVLALLAATHCGRCVLCSGIKPSIPQIRVALGSVAILPQLSISSMWTSHHPDR